MVRGDAQLRRRTRSFHNSPPSRPCTSARSSVRPPASIYDSFFACFSRGHQSNSPRTVVRRTSYIPCIFCATNFLRVRTSPLSRPRAHTSAECDGETTAPWRMLADCPLPNRGSTGCRRNRGGCSRHVCGTVCRSVVGRGLF